MKRGFCSTMGAVFLFALAGCGGAVGGSYANSDCRVTAVCPGGYYCEASNGVCYASGYHAGCLHDLDCGPGAYCAGDGNCYLESGCHSDGDCAPGYACPS